MTKNNITNIKKTKDGLIEKSSGRKVKSPLDIDKVEHDWNDGYILEGLDRCHTIALLLQELLNGHPSMIKAKVECHRSKAYDEVMAMYQKIGALTNEG